MLKAKAILSGCVIFLFGCASNLSLPSDTARIRFVATSDLYSHVYSFENYGCKGGRNFEMTIQQGGLDIDTSDSLLGMPLMDFDPKSVKEYEHPAPQRYYGAVSTNGNIIKYGDSSASSINLFCAVTFSVKFQPGKDYEFVHKVKLTEDDIDCSVLAYQLVEKDDGSFTRIPEPVLPVFGEKCAEEFN
ncbi:hypothetical protein L4D06_19750 [Enterovibrio makurazakiensis]|uniref:hypothetical protein n=1 Tax=Enterovibrio makurazakiensis TaxID=2910232 RepID=UPI003D2121FA